MPEYIEREAAISGLDELERTSRHNSVLWPDHVEECRETLRAIPAADVRPVVLCRDCKHNKGAGVWRFLDLDDVTADCSAGHGYPPMDWFCADGERRPLDD